MNLTVDEILKNSIDALGAIKGSLQLYDKQQDCLLIAAHVGFQPEFLDHFREVRKGPSCVCATALDRGSRFVLENVFHDRNFPDLARLFAAEGLTAVQSTPIFDPSGSLYGMVSTHFEHAHRPTEREFRVLDRYVHLAVNLLTAGIPGALAVASAIRAEGQLDAPQYVHILTFECPNCLKPVTATGVTPFRNLEMQDAAEFHLRCECSWSGKQLGVMARNHAIVPWRQR